jgi:hypothetical protein
MFKPKALHGFFLCASMLLFYGIRSEVEDSRFKGRVLSQMDYTALLDTCSKQAQVSFFEKTYLWLPEESLAIDVTGKAGLGKKIIVNEKNASTSTVRTTTVKQNTELSTYVEKIFASRTNTVYQVHYHPYSEAFSQWDSLCAKGYLVDEFIDTVKVANVSDAKYVRHNFTTVFAFPDVPTKSSDILKSSLEFASRNRKRGYTCTPSMMISAEGVVWTYEPEDSTLAVFERDSVLDPRVYGNIEMVDEKPVISGFKTTYSRIKQ